MQLVKKEQNQYNNWYRDLLIIIYVLCGCVILFKSLLYLTSLRYSALLLFIVASVGFFILFFEAESSRYKNILLMLTMVFIYFAIFEFGAHLYSKIFIANRPEAPIFNGILRSYSVLGGELGYQPEPSKRIHARKEIGGRIIYDVEYTFNVDALRETRSKPNADCSYLFFGGSFVFGEGLHDIQTLPYQFSKGLNYNYDVINFGFHGYGPHQMLRSLELGMPDKLIKNKVSTVFYIFHPQHIFRLSGLTRWNRFGPKYIHDKNGRLHYAGALNLMGGLFESRTDFIQAILALLRNSRLFTFAYGFPETLKPKYIQRSINLLTSIMARAERIVTEKYGADFVIVTWSDPSSEISNNAIEALKNKNLTLIDKSDLLLQEWGDQYLIPLDRHPGELANREIAIGLANLYGSCN